MCVSMELFWCHQVQSPLWDIYHHVETYHYFPKSYHCDNITGNIHYKHNKDSYFLYHTCSADLSATTVRTFRLTTDNTCVTKGSNVFSTEKVLISRFFGSHCKVNVPVGVTVAVVAMLAGDVLYFLISSHLHLFEKIINKRNKWSMIKANVTHRLHLKGHQSLQEERSRKCLDFVNLIMMAKFHKKVKIYTLSDLKWWR